MCSCLERHPLKKIAFAFLQNKPSGSRGRETEQECGICFEPFNDPRGIPCLHVFCCRCLKDWAEECSEDMSIVSCPLCKKTFPIPDEGVNGFPVDLRVTYLRETSTVPECFLECGICSEPFNDPRGLPCLHVFCLGCLKDWVAKCSGRMGIVSCPQCQQTLPDRGVTGFPVDFRVTGLRETAIIQTKVEGFN